MARDVRKSAISYGLKSSGPRHQISALYKTGCVIEVEQEASGLCKGLQHSDMLAVYQQQNQLANAVETIQVSPRGRDPNIHEAT